VPGMKPRDLTPDELLSTTRTVRKRLDLTRPVERELIEECLGLAFQAPTGGNLQGWHFVLVTEPGRKKALAARARGLAPTLGADAELLEAAAWLHDIGYLPELAQTGMHGLDGARYLRDVHHAEPLLCRLVAHHSCAVIEAEERGLADLLSGDFDPAPRSLADALTFCDMTTSPDGEQVHVTRRLAEIHDRYGSGHLVSRTMRRATPLILEAVDRVHASRP